MMSLILVVLGSMGMMFKQSSWGILVILILFWGIMRGENWGSLGSGLGCDPLSGFLLILTLLIFYLMLMSSNKIWEQEDNSSKYQVLIMLLLILLCLSFSSMNMLWFFVWFESLLLPLYLLIMGWGNQYERFGAGLYLVFYTLFGSLPLLVGLLFWGDCHSLMILVLEKESIVLMWKIGFLGAFLVKLPMYFLHYWLPKAHVEAPVSGSMLLAGVLLKLGGYGVYRVYLFLIPGVWECYLMSVGLLGGIYASFVCFRQVDVKSLVAYSSIGHMGLFLSGFMTSSGIGNQGGILLMVGHGFCSSGLFCLMNFFYERINSRNLLVLSGFMSLSPSLMFWSFLLLASNMSAPPSLNLLGELHLFTSLIVHENISGILLFCLFMLGGGYSLYVYSWMGHSLFWVGTGMKSMSLREQLLMLMHWAPLNLGFLIMDM